MKIAIIGAGIAGINVLRYYCENKKNESIELLIFDREDHAGRGLPFMEDDQALLLNQRQNRMSLDGKFDGYINWLKDNDPVSVDREFTSRAQFGQYALDVFNKYIKKENVKFYNELVEDIEKEDNKFKIKTKENFYLVDGVHLCIGQLPLKDYYGLKNSKNFIETPYPLIDKKDRLLNTQRLGIIGSGLSAVDIIVFLYKYNYKGIIKTISRNGLFPLVRGKKAQVKTPNLDIEIAKEKPSLEAIIEAIKKDALNYKISFNMFKELLSMSVYEGFKFQLDHLEELGILQEIILKNKYKYPDVWEKLSMSDRLEFMKNYKTLYLIWQSPMPKENTLKIMDLLEKDKLRIYSDIKDIKFYEQFIITTKEKSLKADIIINATGPSMNLGKLAYENDTSRLIRKLYEDRLVDNEELGGIKIKYPSFSVISQKFGTMPNFKAHGELVIGNHFINNGISLISDKVPEAVDHMVKTLKSM